MKAASRGCLLRASNQVTLCHLLAGLINCSLAAKVTTELSLVVNLFLILAIGLGLLTVLIFCIREIRELSTGGGSGWIGT